MPDLPPPLVGTFLAVSANAWGPVMADVTGLPALPALLAVGRPVMATVTGLPAFTTLLTVCRPIMVHVSGPAAI